MTMKNDKQNTMGIEHLSSLAERKSLGQHVFEWDHRPRGRGRYKTANNLVAQASPPALDRCGEAGTPSLCRIFTGG